MKPGLSSNWLRFRRLLSKLSSKLFGLPKGLLTLGGFLLLGWGLVTLASLTTQGSFDSILIDFREDVGKGQIVEFLNEWGETQNARPRLNSEFSEVDQIYVVDGGQSVLRQLRQSSAARLSEFIEPNYLYSLPEATPTQFPVNPGKENSKKSDSPVPNDPLYPQQWNLHSIGTEAAWALTKGKDITVAIVDTGIAKVPDLNENRLVDGYDFINDETNASDDQGHGTHIAGTIAQNTNNGYGSAGIAPEAKLMPLKVVSVGGIASAADISEAIRYAADNGADVINLSLVGTGYSQLMQQSIDYAYRKGATIVAAAGNGNQNAVLYPGRYRHVLAVSAHDISNKRTPYSNFGAGVDLSAPGGLVSSEKPMGGIVQNTFDLKTKESLFSPYQGSSFAAAHVSGAVALIKSLEKLEPAQVEEILARSSRRSPSDPLNEYGSGQLDLARAIKIVQTKQIPKINFWRWLNNQAYLGAHFWINPNMLTSPQRLWMLGGAFLCALLWSIKYAVRWNGWLILGLVLSSSGLFFLQAVYGYGAPQWIFRLFGSALPEVGTVAQGIPALDPISASVLLPLALWLLLFRFTAARWFAIGVAIGLGPGLIGQIWPAPDILNVTSGWVAQVFLGCNAIATTGLSWLLLRPHHRKPRSLKSASPQPISVKPAAPSSSPKVVPLRPKARLTETSGEANVNTEASVKMVGDEDP